MGFVKLDCGILNSSLWFEKDCRDIFITALLMAEPFEVVEPMEQLKVSTLESTGWEVPPGWYGMVQAAGPGIVSKAGIPQEQGIPALAKLGSPDLDSRSRDFEGRRLVRVDGGYIVLNYMKYRDRDYTAADRMRRLRERKMLRRNVTDVTRNGVDVTRNVTQAEYRVQSTEAEGRKQSTDSDPPLCCTVCDGGIKTKKFTKPTIEELTLHAAKIGLPESEVKRFLNYYESNGWRVGKNPMKSWPHAMQTWKLNYESGRYQSSLGPNRTQPDGAADRNRHLAGTNDEYIKAGLKL